MIDKTLILLRNRLNEHLGSDPDESPEDKVVFVDGEQTDPLTFKLGAITVLLINIDEENVLRAPDRHARVSSDGIRQKVDPDIRVNLHVLFVARFKEYEESLRHLTLIIRYFQSHRVFNHENTPELGDDIEQLVLELVSLPFSEQNEVWNALRVTYQPSVLYRARLLVFKDQQPEELPAPGERDFRISQ